METTVETIRTWEQLLDVGVNAITEDFEPKQLKFDKRLVVKIQVRGDSWDGSIDYRGAQYVVDLQNAVIKAARELLEDEVALSQLRKRVIVKVKVVKGSSIFEVNLGNALTTMVNSMSGTQITLLAGLAILCAAGYFTVNKILQYKEKVLLDAQNKKLTETITEKLSGTLDKALQVIQNNDIQTPAKKLINKLQDDDKILLPGEDLMDAAEAKKLYPRKPRTKTQSGNFDGNYVIKAINMEKHPIQFKIIHEEYPFWAKAQLLDEDVERISESFKLAIKNNKDFMLDLNLFVTYDDRGLRTASIVSTGPPRSNTQDLSKLISRWPKK